jgi:predicted AlkP superfamily phosphohydrolase/phosphomutase
MNRDATPRSPRVLAVAWDAAEPRLVERWLEDGTLPNLALLRARGGYGRLASSADWLAGSVWPTFYTGRAPADHGLYHFLQWRACRMGLARPGPDWLPLHPFWRRLGESGLRVVAVDVPLVYPPEPFPGVEISGWATHDRLAPPAAHPASVLEWVRREFGPPPLGGEAAGLQRLGELLKLRDELVETTGRLAALALALMSREPWDLFLVSFGAPHPGGHKLWDLSGVRGEVAPGERARMSGALREVYAAADAALGQLVRAAGEDVSTLVFSLHGMGPNTTRAGVLPAMLDSILAVDSRPAPGSRPAAGAGRKGLLARLRALVPLELRHAFKRRLPAALQDRLTLFWRTGRTDWAATRAMALLADAQGYIRINQRGREAVGVVAAGEESERLCAEIAAGLRTFVDADSGEPVVEDVIRIDELYPGRTLRSDFPDLIVRWHSSPTAAHREIVSPRHGSIPWPTPGRNPDGRSGNHRPQGFLVAAADGFPPRSRIEGGHILDLAPTLCALLEVSPPFPMEGGVLSAGR